MAKGTVMADGLSFREVPPCKSCEALEAQLQCEGEHTAAATDEIERLRARLALYEPKPAPMTAERADDLSKRAT